MYFSDKKATFFLQHRFGLIALGLMSLWWWYMNHIHYLMRMGSTHIAGGSAWADLPFHLNIASSFQNGVNQDAGITSSLMSTFYAGTTLAYPFIPDFFLSVLVAAGADWHGALVITGTLLLSSLFSIAIFPLPFSKCSDTG